MAMAYRIPQRRLDFWVYNFQHTYLLTHSTEQSPYWEADRFSASQEIPHTLWNPKIHYRIHKCPPPDPILGQLDPVHATTSQFLKIHLNIIFPSTPGSSKWSFSLRFPHQNPVCTSALPLTCYIHRPFHFSNFITRTILGEEYKSLISSLCSFLHSPVTSSLLGPNILHSTLSRTPSAYVPPWISATEFHTHTIQQAI